MGGVLPRPGLALSHSATALSAASCSGEKSGMVFRSRGQVIWNETRTIVNGVNGDCAGLHALTPLRRLRLRLHRKIFGEPVLDHAVHPRVAFCEHEVIGIGK